MPARHHAAATSVAALRRLPSTRSSPRTSRAGSSGVTRRSVPCRATSRRNSAGISSAASSASHFGRALCTGCGQGFVIAFSCNGRGVCSARLSRARQPWEPLAFPSAARQDGAMDGPPCLWLAPPVPVRQWVISVPKRLRGFLADRPAAVAALTRIFIEEIERLLGAAAGVTSDASGRATKVRYVLPRRWVTIWAANWVGPGRSRTSTRPGANGVVKLSPFEFLDRFADFVPPPRKRRHRYHGVFAPNHKLRRAVTAHDKRECRQARRCRGWRVCGRRTYGGRACHGRLL
jgi:hypothetical protein